MLVLAVFVLLRNQFRFQKVDIGTQLQLLVFSCLLKFPFFEGELLNLQILLSQQPLELVEL